MCLELKSTVARGGVCLLPDGYRMCHACEQGTEEVELELTTAQELDANK